MCGSRAWTRYSEEYLIEKFRQNRCLWDIRAEGYTKKKVRKKLYNEFALLLRTHFKELSSITGEQVRAKCNHLRQYFKREYRKTESTPGGSAVQQSKWKFFDALSFLKNTMDEFPTESNQNTEPQVCSSAVVENLEDIEIDSKECLVLEPTDPLSSSLDASPTTCTSVEYSSTPPPFSSPSPEPPQATLNNHCRPQAKRRRISDPVDEHCLKAVKVLTDVLNKNTEDDFCAHFGKSMESWLRGFKPDVRGIVAHKVNMVIGEMAEKHGVIL